ncbi:charged multivesicular body protein 4b-like isoform 4-T4 [Acanthopagrus schlegelii]
MSFSVEMSSGEEMRKKPCEQQEPEKLSQSQELLTKMKEYLEKRIDRELLNVKKNSRENRRVALQALRGKKWCEKHLTYIDCAVKAIRSTNEHMMSCWQSWRGWRRIWMRLPLRWTEQKREFLFSQSHPPHLFPVLMEEDEIEAELQYLWRWLNESS